MWMMWICFIVLAGKLLLLHSLNYAQLLLLLFSGKVVQHYHDCHLMSEMDMLPKIIPQFSDIIILSIQNGIIIVDISAWPHVSV